MDALLPESPSSPSRSYDSDDSNYEAYSLHLTENSLIATAVMKLNNRTPIDGSYSKSTNV